MKLICAISISIMFLIGWTAGTLKQQEKAMAFSYLHTALENNPPCEAELRASGNRYAQKPWHKTLFSLNNQFSYTANMQNDPECVAIMKQIEKNSRGYIVFSINSQHFIE